MRNNVYNLRNLRRVNYREISGNRNNILIKSFDNTRPISRDNIVNNNDPDFELEPVDLWKNFNIFHRATGISGIKTADELVSGSQVKNYLLKDPILDIFRYNPSIAKQYDPTIRSYQHFNKPLQLKNIMLGNDSFELTNHVIKFSTNNSNNCSIPMQKGMKYETKVYEKLKSEYCDNVVCIISNLNEICVDDYIKTFKEMKKGIPIIYQGVLYNSSNSTYGVADFIVRSDFVNKMFANNVLTEEEEIISAPRLESDYHYIIIDAKWTTMPLCADGELIRNSGRFPAYKGQLAIYNAALGFIQGYTPDRAYILAKSFSYTENGDKYCGYDTFDRLGVIDYSGFDKMYIEKTEMAIKWIRDVRQNGHTWKIDPPEKFESFPNMSNNYDSPYHNIKVGLAKKNGELTQLWNVGPKNRKIGLDNGIRSLNDRRCSAKLLGINGKKQGPILNKIIKINRPGSKNNILPRKVKNNVCNWQSSNNFELFIDFETVEGCIITNRMELDNSEEPTKVLFMIGVGFIENGHWIYKSFNMERYNIENERKIVQEFTDYVVKITNDQQKVNNFTGKPILYHWGNAEKSILNTVNFRHNFIWSNWLNQVNLVDFCKIYKDEPITVKGSLNFGLKSIAKAMYDLNLIKTKWATGSGAPVNGYMAMEDAIKFYKFMEEFDRDPTNKDTMYNNNIKFWWYWMAWNIKNCRTIS